jgi:fermentation-respiration switch protein FrsA (DUF1100 family)
MLMRFLQSIIPLLLLGLLLYIAQSLYLYLFQDRLVYLSDYPSRELSATPAQIGLEFESVNLSASDGVRLHGWFLPHEKPRATLLFFHGNAGNISHRLDSLAMFHHLGLSVLIIDYRGYGQSEGDTSEAGIYRDAEAAWHHLTLERQIAPDRILLFGRSLGGAVAGYLASQHEALGVVLESTFTSAPDLASDLYPWLPARWLARLDYDTRTRLSAIGMPLMIVHSREDEIIPFSHAEILYNEAQSPKHFLHLQGSHNYGFMANRERYHQALDEFIVLCLMTKPHAGATNNSVE